MWSGGWGYGAKLRNWSPPEFDSFTGNFTCTYWASWLLTLDLDDSHDVGYPTNHLIPRRSGPNARNTELSKKKKEARVPQLRENPDY